MKMIFAVSIILKMSLSLHSLLRNKKAEWRCLWLASLLQSIFIDTVYFHAKNSNVFIFFIYKVEKQICCSHTHSVRKAFIQSMHQIFCISPLHLLWCCHHVRIRQESNRFLFSFGYIFHTPTRIWDFFLSFLAYWLPISFFFFYDVKCEWRNDVAKKIALFGDGGSVSLLYFLETQKGPKRRHLYSSSLFYGMTMIIFTQQHHHKRMYTLLVTCSKLQRR